MERGGGGGRCHGGQRGRWRGDARCGHAPQQYRRTVGLRACLSSQATETKVRFVDNQMNEERAETSSVTVRKTGTIESINYFFVPTSGTLQVIVTCVVFKHCPFFNHPSGVGCGGCERKQSLERANASHSGVGAIRHSNKQIQSRGNNPRQQVVDLSGSVLSERIVRFECNSLLLITRNRELGPPLRALPL